MVLILMYILSCATMANQETIQPEKYLNKIIDIPQCAQRRVSEPSRLASRATSAEFNVALKCCTASAFDSHFIDGWKKHGTKHSPI